MPEVRYTTMMRLPPEAIWDFVKDMNNWAPMLTGYQKHEILDEHHSRWTLKGDVGILARTVHLDVQITEWNGPKCVRFSLKGINEVVEGGGSFVAEPFSGSPEDADTKALGHDQPKAVSPAEGHPEKTRPGLLRRFVQWIFRRIFTLLHGRVERPNAPTQGTIAQGTKLTFTLRMDAGGPTGPLVNAMLEPALLPAAEDLGAKIAAHLEKSAAA
jgi:carbon monoxide dehydrogenase subunit G